MRTATTECTELEKERNLFFVWSLANNLTWTALYSNMKVPAGIYSLYGHRDTQAPYHDKVPNTGGGGGGIKKPGANVILKRIRHSNICHRPLSIVSHLFFRSNISYISCFDILLQLVIQKTHVLFCSCQFLISLF